MPEKNPVCAKYQQNSEKLPLLPEIKYLFSTPNKRIKHKFGCQIPTPTQDNLHVTLNCVVELCSNAINSLYTLIVCKYLHHCIIATRISLLFEQNIKHPKISSLVSVRCRKHSKNHRSLRFSDYSPDTPSNWRSLIICIQYMCLVPADPHTPSGHGSSLHSPTPTLLFPGKHALYQAFVHRPTIL